MLADIDPEFEYDKIDEHLYDYIVTRDIDLCVLCGCAGHEIHHIIFKSQGGTNRPNNLALLCKNCHAGQHSHKPKPNEKIYSQIARNEKRLRSELA